MKVLKLVCHLLKRPLGTDKDHLPCQSSFPGDNTTPSEPMINKIVCSRNEGKCCPSSLFVSNQDRLELAGETACCKC